MRYFLVSFAFSGGFGRRLFGPDGPINEEQILFWEEACAKTILGESVSIIAISEIDGPVAPTAKSLAQLA